MHELPRKRLWEILVNERAVHLGFEIREVGSNLKRAEGPAKLELELKLELLRKERDWLKTQSEDPS